MKILFHFHFRLSLFFPKKSNAGYNYVSIKQIGVYHRKPEIFTDLGKYPPATTTRYNIVKWLRFGKYLNARIASRG